MQLSWVQSINCQVNNVLQWKIIHPLSNEEIIVGEKGSVQEALMANGLLPDPFYGMNEKEFGWIENHSWTFVSEFVMDSVTIAEHEFMELLFPSIDTYAKVYFNETLILTADNAFKPYSVQIQENIKIGLNKLKVVFTSPVQYHQKMFEEASYKLPAPNDIHPIAIAPYTRKPQYQFGWDWALRINTMGFNKPVQIHWYSKNEIVSKNIQTLEIEDGSATMLFQLQLKNDLPLKKWESKLFGKLDYKQNGSIVTATVNVNQPELWWPRGHGVAFLYEDEWTVDYQQSKKSETKNIRFGIRTSELIQEKDQWGTSYTMKINGRELFCKGGDYIPQDIFPARVKEEDIVKMVETMYASNFNMVRVWGGGYYPDEIFFETCDRLGLMVWQDFMFACAMYPGDSIFLQNVKEELDYQIPRISSHPSVVLFNGNNEVDVAWKNWGFQLKYNLYGKKAEEIETSYNRLFKDLAPKCIRKNTTIPYIHTSPLSNWGNDEYYNHGSQHYWGVWHGKDPLEDFGKKIGRFNAEYGFQSFPEYSTLSTFSEKKEWDLESEVMKHHQKSYVGNGMILKHAEKLYGKPKDFEEFVYFSQLTQAKAVGIAVSGHRIDAPRCSGTLYWQVNDCWPGPTWSSIDYFGNWKALNYQVQTDFKDVTVLTKEENPSTRSYFLVSDVPHEFEATVKCSVYNLKGELIEIHELTKKVRGATVLPLLLEKMIDPSLKSYVLVFEWNDHIGKSHSRTNVITNEPRKVPVSSSDYSLELIKIENGYELTIKNSETLIDAWIYSNEKAFHLEENFKTLLPGNHVFKILTEKELTKEIILLKYR